MKKILYITSRQSGKKTRMDLWMERLEEAGYDVTRVNPNDKDTFTGLEFGYTIEDEYGEISDAAYKIALDRLNDKKNT